LPSPPAESTHRSTSRSSTSVSRKSCLTCRLNRVLTGVAPRPIGSLRFSRCLCRHDRSNDSIHPAPTRRFRDVDAERPVSVHTRGAKTARRRLGTPDKPMVPSPPGSRNGRYNGTACTASTPSSAIGVVNHV
jgi:hypothetical protein